MHPRNPYRVPPDFVSLAQLHEPLKKHLITEGHGPRPTVDFRNDEALRCLTQAILLRDFGLQITIPNDRLCPPVPNRLNYILWLQDIVTAHDKVLGNEKREIRGLDIGTGSTAIYPLLGCKWDMAWTFVATELDDKSFLNARENIFRNGLESRVQLRKAPLDGNILFPLNDEPFIFTMCNPPFYGSQKEIDDSAQDKDLPPNAACTGADIEMIYSNGGESGFVGRMVDESIHCPTSCRWFTSMLGKLSSVQHIVQQLRDNDITNYAVTEFVQGQTRRWAIGWSFFDTRLPDSIARIQSIGPNHPLHRLLPPRNVLLQSFPAASRQDLWQALINVLDSVSGVTATEKAPFASVKEEDSNAALLLVEAQGNTWSRSARRKTKKLSETDALNAVAEPGDDLDALPAQVNPETQTYATAPTLEFQWVYGRDRALFESFVSHVTRKIGLAVKATEQSKSPT
ncbi:hypothetical protein BJ165DRAFT_1350914 [Panaeolus papilionaceus]|nr:hypothetical protein BJ165DRAFT_1350914 [Panaeolus papilionaceus]